uniref:Putative F-box protein CPR30-like n=1 Tax=Davidia involucrata TaxID=16924 RepID=A0A5B7BHI8_DAVIN
MDRNKRQRKPAIEGDTSSLPCEIVYNILSRLPVKSLMRFQCICKPWHAVISDPEFAKTHFSLNPRQRLLCSDSSGSFYSIDYESSCPAYSRKYSREERILFQLKNDDSIDCEERIFFPLKKDPKTQVLCSCNGLVLLRLHDDKKYALWNPSTRAYKEFLCPYDIYFFSLWGLCYDSSNHDYKVVLIQFYDPRLLLVYNLKSNSWKKIREFPCSIIGGDKYGGVIMNGNLHWVVVKGSEDIKSRAIVCFDLIEDEFKEVPQPNFGVVKIKFHVNIMGGCLCVYRDMSLNEIEDRFEVWVMKEYGMENSWTKLFIIPRKRSLYHLKILCFTKKGEVVMAANKERLVIYNPKEKKFGNLMKLKGDTRVTLTAISYLDTLVSPSW